LKTPITIARASYGELFGRLVLTALIIAGLFAGIAARWP
jgi:hypothetical protein